MADGNQPVDPESCSHPIMHQMEEQIIVSTDPLRKERGRTFCGLCKKVLWVPSLERLAELTAATSEPVSSAKRK